MKQAKMINRTLPSLVVMILSIVTVLQVGCRKEKLPDLRYFEVGTNNQSPDWRDSSFVVATSDRRLITEIEAQLALPVAQRKIVIGSLEKGSGGYNKTGTHEFKWRFREDDWQLADVSVEIYDGRPYSDVDLHLDYWMDTVKRFSPWSSYIKKELVR